MSIRELLGKYTVAAIHRTEFDPYKLDIRQSRDGVDLGTVVIAEDRIQLPDRGAVSISSVQPYPDGLGVRFVAVKKSGKVWANGFLIVGGPYRPRRRVLGFRADSWHHDYMLDPIATES